MERPYICQCAFCGNGLLRFIRCGTCDQIVVLCDECELMWEEVAQVGFDANLSSDTSYPQCPACGADVSSWTWPSLEEIDEDGFGPFVAGESI